jgi:hypothetical protein
MDSLVARTKEDKALAIHFDYLRQSKPPLKPGDRVGVGPNGGFYEPQKSYFDFVKSNVCSSDVIVIGRPVTKRVLLNSRGTFLFTVYSIEPTRWFWPRSGPYADAVPFVLPGGKTTVSGQITYAGVPEAPFLNPQVEVILFLSRIKNLPERDQLIYEPTGKIRIVTIDPSGYAVLPPEWAPADYQRVFASAFKTDIVNATNSCTVIG